MPSEHLEPRRSTSTDHDQSADQPQHRGDDQQATRTVLIAPDSFKGSISATDAAAAIADGWRRVGDHDRLLLFPLADGGEGTVDAVAAARPDGILHTVEDLSGPDLRPVTAHWLQLGDHTAVMEMASVSGLPLMAELDPLGASTVGLGELINNALDAGMRTIIVGAGGSATTDGGAGALSALGLRLLDRTGAPVPPGGGGLTRLDRIEGTARRPEKLIMLSDVDAPLLGPAGAASVFGPQKGADHDQIAVLDAGLARFAELLGGDTEAAGCGAAGGLGYGLTAGLGAEIVPGAPYLSELAGLDAAYPDADLVITGEGRFDRTSLGGKVVGHVLQQAEQHHLRRVVIAGQLGLRLPEVAAYGLSEVAGSAAAALADPGHWLSIAGSLAAQDELRSAENAP